MATNPEAAPPLVTENQNAAVDHQKIDHITSLQEGIDGLSLSLFEALRGLRDAVASESGNLGGVQQGNNNNNDGFNNSPTDSSENDYEEFCLSYQNGDPETKALVIKHATTAPTREKDFRQIHEKIQEQKDDDLVKKVAGTVLEKSADIDRRVSSLPGMHRTRMEQMKLIEELIENNLETAKRLEDAYNRAEQQRKRVRTFVRENTCKSLGIIED